MSSGFASAPARIYSAWPEYIRPGPIREARAQGDYLLLELGEYDVKR
jgi:hypothetical protein